MSAPDPPLLEHHQRLLEATAINPGVARRAATSRSRTRPRCKQLGFSAAQHARRRS